MSALQASPHFPTRTTLCYHQEGRAPREHKGGRARAPHRSRACSARAAGPCWTAARRPAAGPCPARSAAAPPRSGCAAAPRARSTAASAGSGSPRRACRGARSQFWLPPHAGCQRTRRDGRRWSDAGPAEARRARFGSRRVQAAKHARRGGRRWERCRACRGARRGLGGAQCAGLPCRAQSRRGTGRPGAAVGPAWLVHPRVFRGHAEHCKSLLWPWASHVHFSSASQADHTSDR